MFRLGAFLVTIGLIGLVLPIFGIQFVVVTAAAEFLGISSVLASVVVIVLGFAVVLAPTFVELLKALLVILVAIGKGLIGLSTGEKIPTIEELFEHRGPYLSEDTIRCIYPFSAEMWRRYESEPYDVVHDDIAPRAGVSREDVDLFQSISTDVFKARVAAKSSPSQYDSVGAALKESKAEMDKQLEALQSMSREEKES